MNSKRWILAAVATLLYAAGCIQPPVHELRLPPVRFETAPIAPVTRQDASASGPAMQELEAAAIEPYHGRFFIGGRLGVNAGDGVPANDIPTAGLYGRYRLRGPWLLGAAVDLANFDFETPADIVNLPAAEVVDASIDAVSVTVWGEYEIRLPDERFDRLRPFVGAGVGVASLSDDQITGPLQGGGTFDLDIGGGVEIIPGAVGGLRVDLLRNLVFEVGVRADYHFTELEVTDNIGGGTQGVDDYPTFGIYGGLLVRL